MTAATPPPKFDHLLRLTDHRGTFEHACFAEPRPEHGYCTDDMARVLVVATREPDADGQVNGLAGLAVRFLNEAQAYNGACRNRMDRNGRWTDEPTTDDHWGRCIWGLGTAAAHSDVSMVRRLAVIQFERAAQARSPSPRAMAFAALGAAELLAVDPEHPAARKLLTDYAASLAAPNGDSSWPWPEPRLTYANAVLPEAMIAAGVALDDPALRQRGLDLLALAARLRNGRRPPVADSGGGQRGRRRQARLRPAADRGGHTRRCVRACRCRRRRCDLARRRRGRCGLVPGRQRRRTAHVGPGDRRRIRRTSRRRGEP